MATTFKWLAGTSRGNQLTTELNALANAGFSAVGPAYDNTANLDEWGACDRRRTSSRCSAPARAISPLRQPEPTCLSTSRTHNSIRRWSPNDPDNDERQTARPEGCGENTSSRRHAFDLPGLRITPGTCERSADGRTDRSRRQITHTTTAGQAMREMRASLDRHFGARVSLTHPIGE